MQRSQEDWRTPEHSLTGLLEKIPAEDITEKHIDRLRKVEERLAQAAEEAQELSDEAKQLRNRLEDEREGQTGNVAGNRASTRAKGRRGDEEE